MKANRIEHYRRIHPWENFFLDSALYSVGQALGIAYEEGFQPVAAVTGDLFAYLYSREKYCDSGLTNSFFRPESVEEVYAMYGYACRYLSREEIRADFAAAMALIRASVDRGIPVLAWGCGGVRTKSGETYDPLPEGSLIGGYEEDELLYVNLYPGEDRLAETSAGGRPASISGDIRLCTPKKPWPPPTVCFWWGTGWFPHRNGRFAAGQYFLFLSC